MVSKCGGGVTAGEPAAPADDTALLSRALLSAVTHGDADGINRLLTAAVGDNAGIAPQRAWWLGTREAVGLLGYGLSAPPPPPLRNISAVAAAVTNNTSLSTTTTTTTSTSVVISSARVTCEVAVDLLIAAGALPDSYDLLSLRALASSSSSSSSGNNNNNNSRITPSLVTSGRGGGVGEVGHGRGLPVPIVAFLAQLDGIVSLAPSLAGRAMAHLSLRGRLGSQLALHIFARGCGSSSSSGGGSVSVGGGNDAVATTTTTSISSFITAPKLKISSMTAQSREALRECFLILASRSRLIFSPASHLVDNKRSSQSVVSPSLPPTTIITAALPIGGAEVLVALLLSDRTPSRDVLFRERRGSQPPPSLSLTASTPPPPPPPPPPTRNSQSSATDITIIDENDNNNVVVDHDEDEEEEEEEEEMEEEEDEFDVNSLEAVGRAVRDGRRLTSSRAAARRRTPPTVVVMMGGGVTTTTGAKVGFAGTGSARARLTAAAATSAITSTTSNTLFIPRPPTSNTTTSSSSSSSPSTSSVTSLWRGGAAVLALLSPAHGARAASHAGLSLRAAAQICAFFGFHEGSIAAAIALLSSAAATATASSTTLELDMRSVATVVYNAASLAVYSDDSVGLSSVFNAASAALKAAGGARCDTSRVIISAALQGASDALLDRDAEDALESTTTTPPQKLPTSTAALQPRIITLHSGCIAALTAFAPVAPLELARALLGVSEKTTNTSSSSSGVGGGSSGVGGGLPFSSSCVVSPFVSALNAKDIYFLMAAQ